MKNLNFRKFDISEADVLTKLQMRKIIGGNVPPATICDHQEGECHRDGDKIYRCSVTGSEREECCCGHSDYNDNCVIV